MQDEISLSVISFLERHAGITDVQYFERPPCAARDIENWERAHYPCVLPEDFKSFLRLSDGLLLKWSIKQNELTQPLGCMQVNDVANLSPCPRGSFAPGEGVIFHGCTAPGVQGDPVEGIGGGAALSSGGASTGRNASEPRWPADLAAPNIPIAGSTPFPVAGPKPFA